MTGTPAGTTRDTGSGRGRAVGVVCGVLLLALSTVMFGLVPGRLAEKDAYRSAPVCPAGTRPGGSCRLAVEATVRDRLEVHEKRSPTTTSWCSSAVPAPTTACAWPGTRRCTTRSAPVTR